jgi:hypothetical protein
MTIVEFFTNKLKALHPHKEIVSLSQELITAEEGLRWAQEFNQLHLQCLKRNKMTAVEFLYERLERMIPRTALYNMDKEDYFKQAKEMEKQQIERMYSDAIEFAEWIRIKDFQTATGNKWIGLNMEYYTTQELYEQFKKK